MVNMLNFELSLHF